MWWTFVLKNIISGILSSTAGQWFLKTRLGLWISRTLDRFANFLEKRYNITILKKETKWRKQYPLLANRIDKLEEWSHPPVAAGGATELMDMIKALEERVQKMEEKND
jgi:hypothetical protein